MIVEPYTRLTPAITSKLPRYCNIVFRNKFKIEIKFVQNIEDLSDQFLTETQVQEIFERQSIPPYFTTHLFKNKIEETLADWITLIKPGKKSTTCKNPIIEELCASVETESLNSSLCSMYPDPNLTYRCTKTAITKINREGGYHSITKRSERLLIRDWTNLTKLMQQGIKNKHDINVTYCLYREDFLNNLVFTKKVLKWPDIQSILDGNSKYYWSGRLYIAKEDHKWLKKLWDHPKLFESFLVKYKTT